MNAVGVALTMIAEVREKWKSLHSRAKKEFTKLANEQKKMVVGQLQRHRRLQQQKSSTYRLRYTFFYRPEGNIKKLGGAAVRRNFVECCDLYHQQ